MVQVRNVVLLSFAALGLLVIVGLFLLMLAQVYMGWHARHTVAAYADVATPVRAEEQAAFVQVLTEFGKANGFSVDSKTYDQDRRKEIVVMIEQDNQTIYTSNHAAPELFETSFFGKSKPFEDMSLPDRFVAAINAQFGARAVRKR